MATLEELLALLPDNNTGQIDAVDLRVIVTELWGRQDAALSALSDHVDSIDARVRALEEEEPPAIVQFEANGEVAPGGTTYNAGQVVDFDAVLSFDPVGDVALQAKFDGAPDTAWATVRVMTGSGREYRYSGALYYDLNQDADETWNYRVRAVAAPDVEILSPVYTIDAV